MGDTCRLCIYWVYKVVGRGCLVRILRLLAVGKLFGSILLEEASVMLDKVHIDCSAVSCYQ